MLYPDPNSDPRHHEPPVYTGLDPTVKQVEHSFSLEKDGHSPLSLSLLSSADSAERSPRLHQGQILSGTVGLDLQADSHIRAVTVTLTGEILAHANKGSHVFLSEKEELYSTESKDTISPGSENDRVPGSTKLKKGKHAWPFAIKLPKGVGIPFEGKDGRISKYILPPSLEDKQSNITIKYQLLVHVKRGTFSSDQKLLIPIEYLPLVRPDPPSVSRQVAYLENTPLRGPGDDAEGWVALPVRNVKGTVFNTRQVEFTYSVWLASPKCYTRNTPLPLWVEIVCADLQALDLISSPQAHAIRLVRTSSYSDRPYPFGFIDPQFDTRVAHSEDIALADLWAVDPHNEKRTDCRVLQGEIHVPAGIPPDCEIMDYKLEYTVVVNRPNAAGFVASTSSEVSLHSEKVRVATLPSTGPPVAPHAPPPRYSEDTD